MQDTHTITLRLKQGDYDAFAEAVDEKNAITNPGDRLTKSAVAIQQIVNWSVEQKWDREGKQGVRPFKPKKSDWRTL